LSAVLGVGRASQCTLTGPLSGAGNIALAQLAAEGRFQRWNSVGDCNGFGEIGAYMRTAACAAGSTALAVAPELSALQRSPPVNRNLAVERFDRAHQRLAIDMTIAPRGFLEIPLCPRHGIKIHHRQAKIESAIPNDIDERMPGAVGLSTCTI
jgi:hypothetical protein